MPPLKDLPEEIVSDDSDDSSKNIRETLKIEQEIFDLKKNFNIIDRKIFLHIDQVYKKLAEVDKIKADRIAKINA